MMSSIRPSGASAVTADGEILTLESLENIQSTVGEGQYLHLYALRVSAQTYKLCVAPHLNPP
jgi:hypothetical protein